jgi:uridine phosphorylase
VPEGKPIHLRPTTEPAERVLLPGDPGRALALAQLLMSKPLTIQSTGMGGPSAAIVLHELISLGVTQAIRVGTCGALSGALGLGELVVAREVIAADGTSRALGAGEIAYADTALSDALARLAQPRHEGRIVSTDVFYEPDERRNDAWSAAGALAVEMEAATLFTVGASAGIAVACLLIVTDTFDAAGGRTRIDDDSLADAVERQGTAATAALA